MVDFAMLRMLHENIKPQIKKIFFVQEYGNPNCFQIFDITNKNEKEINVQESFNKKYITHTYATDCIFTVVVSDGFGTPIFPVHYQRINRITLDRLHDLCGKCTAYDNPKYSFRIIDNVDCNLIAYTIEYRYLLCRPYETILSAYKHFENISEDFD